MNDTLCSAFWKHTNIRGGDRVFPCCRFKEPLIKFDGDVSSILHTQEYQKLRNDSLSGISIPNCSKCYYEEKLGKESLRQKFNKEYNIDSISLEYIEIGFDNICNLTCDGCWSEFSSSWAKKENPSDLKKTGILNTKEFKNVPSSITNIMFLGGEPLMTNRHFKFLSDFHNFLDITVTYNTNGMFLLNDTTIALFKKFKKIEFIISIDGYEKLNDQVRSGSNWSKILKFINQLIKYNFNFSIHTVIHKNNYQGIFDLEKWIRNNGFKWTTNILTYPKQLDITSLELDLKRSFLKELDKSSVPNKEYILEHLHG
jgi:sulfatase maturation enzyme AslB (radical SAM superfamily)